MTFEDQEPLTRTKWGEVSGGGVVVRRRDGSEVILKDALEAVALRMWPRVLSEAEGRDESRSAWADSRRL